jgi:hypothetical protein
VIAIASSSFELTTCRKSRAATPTLMLWDEAKRTTYQHSSRANLPAETKMIPSLSHESRLLLESVDDMHQYEINIGIDLCGNTDMRTTDAFLSNLILSIQNVPKRNNQHHRRDTIALGHDIHKPSFM